MPRISRITRHRGDRKQDYAMVYEDDSTERVEAISFFAGRGAHLSPAMAIPTEVEGMGVEEANAYLAAHPRQQKWSGLSWNIHEEIEDEDLGRLRYLPELTWLRIRSQRITDAGVAWVGALQALEAAAISSPHVTDASLDILGKLPRLRLVDMQDCPGVTRERFLAVFSSRIRKGDLYPPFEKRRRPPRQRPRVAGKLEGSRNDSRPQGLRFVDLAWRKLQSVPAEVFEKDDVWRIDLISSGVGTIPEEIGRLRQLRVLYANWCRLGKLPEAIGMLTGLEELWLNDNQLRSLPQGLDGLSNLLRLCLDDNPLDEFPRQILALKELEALKLSRTGISDLPEEIGCLRELRQLSLAGNKLRRLPESIAGLEHLEHLSLAHNPLTSIPAGIWRIEGLMTLIIRGTEIREVPPEAERIPNLVWQ